MRTPGSSAWLCPLCPQSPSFYLYTFAGGPSTGTPVLSCIPLAWECVGNSSLLHLSSSFLVFSHLNFEMWIGFMVFLSLCNVYGPKRKCLRNVWLRDRDVWKSYNVFLLTLVVEALTRNACPARGSICPYTNIPNLTSNSLSTSHLFSS